LSASIEEIMSEAEQTKPESAEESTSGDELATEKSVATAEADTTDEVGAEAEVVDLKDAALGKAEKAADDWRNRAMRSAADLENARRRFNKERDELRKFGADGLLKDLFPVLDNLERALAHAESTDGLAEGVQMVLRQFTQILEKNGATSFEAEGQPFDPQIHEAMTQIATSDVEPGHVVSVFQRGWKLHGRLVRPAMVVVAAAPEPDQTEA